jgi:peptide-methionine (R)-S-oxide reductase
MSNGPLAIRKLSETNADKRRAIFQCLLEKYGSCDAIPAEAWLEVLGEEAYRVCRLGSIGSANGYYAKHYAPGVYACVCCGQNLFNSYDKYGAGSWISFSRSIGKVTCAEDTRFGTKRTEVRCQSCDAHLGCVQPDSVSETGLRFSINSAALAFDVEQYDVALRKYSINSI